MNQFRLSAILALLVLSPAFCAETNLVSNGSFEQLRAGSNVPESWSCAGNSAVHQSLTRDPGRDGKCCAKLECTQFTGDGPDFHAMICQVGQVAVRAGQWYRLSLWAKADRIKVGAVDVGLSDTRQWENTGLSEAFLPGPQWQKFDFIFRARKSVPATDSRLQFWFKSTGTVWLDDIVLTETQNTQQWFPQIPTDTVKNFIPNSSFECGASGWGSFTYGLQGWAGNLYRLEGETDADLSQHGTHSLKLSVSGATQPVFYFDYYQPVAQPVRRVLAANRGWFPVTPGQPLTLSVWLRADTHALPAMLLACEPGDRVSRKPIIAGLRWERFEFTFRPSQPFVFVAAGLDLEGSQVSAATLWLDSIQLERGEQATAYEPRQPVECFLDPQIPVPVFTNTASGMDLVLRAFNNSSAEQSLATRLRIEDFFERTVLDEQHALKLRPGAGLALPLPRLCGGLSGYFRASCASAAGTNSVRCAVFPSLAGSADSPFGFNHAYPWDFLVRLAGEAGVTWWRDWSAKWQTVEPAKGIWDFSIPDVQIKRVFELGGQVEVLLPFPSALWSTSARMDEVQRAAGKDSYLQTRLPVAYAPRELADFANYAAAVARHYQDSTPAPVTHIQLLNEPVYTDYALPRKFGYSLKDYLRLVETAALALRSANPNCKIVGGISANLDAGLTRDFVLEGGLRAVDVLDLHMYDGPRPAETFEDSFASLQQLMAAHGGPKSVWISEWGCYADDDPPCVPQTVGDATMNRCRWANERAATEHIVKFAAVSFSCGVRKVFFHAGTCGTINGPDAGGVLFEYGGAPRKMLPGVAALSRFLGVPDECVKRASANGLRYYIFKSGERAVAIVWAEGSATRELSLPSGIQAFDIMGNKLPAPVIRIDTTPIYLTASTPDNLLQALPAVR